MSRLCHRHLGIAACQRMRQRCLISLFTYMQAHIKFISAADAQASTCMQVRQALAGWQLYLRQPILPASAAYVLLFFNAVLGPGGMMTAFLASKGLSGAASGVFRQTLQKPRISASHPKTPRKHCELCGPRTELSSAAIAQDACIARRSLGIAAQDKRPKDSAVLLAAAGWGARLWALRAPGPGAPPLSA